MSKEIAVRAHVARLMGGSKGTKIRFTMEDETSGAHFFEAELTYSQLGELVSGGASVVFNATLHNLDVLGKKRVIEGRVATAPKVGHSRELYEEWLKANCQEEGWLLDSYLGSQNSIHHTADGVILRYNVVKYVDTV